MQIEKKARDEYQLRFLNEMITVDAQAMIDLAKWIEVHRTMILVDIDMKDEIARNRSQGAKDGWEILRDYASLAPFQFE